jgi:hypothetical protein
MIDITVERNHAGAYVLSAIHGGYLVSRQYYGYTKREAVRLFKEELRGA